MGGRGSILELNAEVVPDVVATELDDRRSGLLNRPAQKCANGVRRLRRRRRGRKFCGVRGAVHRC